MVYLDVEMTCLYFLTYDLRAEYSVNTLLGFYVFRRLEGCHSHEAGNCLQWSRKSRAESLASILSPRR